MFRPLSIVASMSIVMSFSGTSIGQQVANSDDGAEVFGQPDPRVRITSPISGAVLAPGEAFTVEVSVDASIQPSQVMVAMSPGVVGFADTQPFRIPAVVPPYFAGQTEIQALVVDVGNQEIQGAPITVLVQPATPPNQLLAADMLVLDEPTTSGTVGGIWVRGVFADGIEIALSSSAAGTTYVSADPWIASVDTEGNVTAVSAGTTIVTSQHGGVSAFTIVHVQGAGPPTTLDVTRQVRVDQTEVRFDRLTDRFVQTITITNDGAIPIPGPLALMLDWLPAEVNWVNHDGVTQHLPPVGADYSSLDLANGVSLVPGESVSVVVRFMAPGQAMITYTPRISQAQWP